MAVIKFDKKKEKEAQLYDAENFLVTGTGQHGRHRARSRLTYLVFACLIIAFLATLCFVSVAIFAKLNHHWNAWCGVQDDMVLPEPPGKVPVSSPVCTNIPLGNRSDCWPKTEGASQDKCTAIGCCWGPLGPEQGQLGDVPWCYFPTNYDGYIVKSTKSLPNGVSVTLARTTSSNWPNEIKTLQLDALYEGKERLHFKIYDPNKKRYEVPIDVIPPGPPGPDRDYVVKIPTQGPFSIEVTRKSTGQTLFNSAGGAPLIFADQFLQFGTGLSTNLLYGLGEHRSSFLVSTNWTKFGMWSRDQPPSTHTNLYGVHPLYLHIEPDHKAHGVFLLNSNAMEVEIQPAPAITYRTTGGILDFYIFTGPTPDTVIQQYTGLVGRPFMPPYWGLGYHLCRWGYGGSNGMKAVIKRMRDANMPYDTQWNDIDYMDRHLDWTYDNITFGDLPAIVQDLHDHGQHYIMIVDPGISSVQPSGNYKPYDDGLARGVFIKKPDGSGPIIGKVWPGETAFPDFFHPNATDYWYNSALNYHQHVPFDGLWTDMNEPSNFVEGSTEGCPSNSYENPPFMPGGVLGTTLHDKTLCASAQQYSGLHYNLHSLYGHSEALASKKALDKLRPNKRTVVISRSTYPSTGTHAGHWTGDNNAAWDNMYYSITDVMSFNMFGIPMVGSDICGFMGNTNAELCARWTQLGAFYPFMRNHNTKGAKDQDPAAFDSGTQGYMRFALNLRYTLLPHLYTLFYRSHTEGTPIIRPIFYQYPGITDKDVYGVDVQFMWGDTLLITPTTSQQTLSGKGYLPKDRWYDFFNYSITDSPGHFINFALPMDRISLLVRGGSIIPMQAPAVTTTLARKNKFTLYAALATDGTASGELYWDDGESTDALETNHYNLIDFSVAKGMLSSQVTKAGYTAEPMVMDTVYVLGVDGAPTSVTVNGQTAHFTYNAKTLTVKDLSVDLLKPLKISW